MNLLGKIFTVLIFIMSMVFMSFAVAVFATHTNWKEKLTGPEGVKPKLEAQKAINVELQTRIEQLNKALTVERAARVNVLAALEAKLGQVQTQLTQKDDELAKLAAAHQILVETNDKAQNTLTALTTEVQTLRDEIRVAQQDRDAQFSQVVALTDSNNQSKAELARFIERRDQMLAKIAMMENVLKKNGLEPTTPVSHIPPPLRGEVLEASNDNLIEISLGSDEGLKKGHFLEASRGGLYLGRLEVVSTQPDVAVARILKPYQKGPIKRGDSVRTKID